MVHHPSRRGLDPRPLRFEQGVVALLLLVGFTFQLELHIPVVTVLLAVSGALGPRRAPLPMVQTGVLVVASLLVFVGLAFLAWLIALAVVATAAFDAATGSWIEARLYWRLARRRRP